MTQVLSMWTVYNRPRDFPGELYVARRYMIEPDGPVPTDDTIVSPSLELVRQALSLKGLTPITRDHNDEPHIVETWL